MRFFRRSIAALLPLLCLVAPISAAAEDRFVTGLSQQLSTSRSLKLDDVSYSELTSAPRDYHVAVLLTALDARFGCGLCNTFQPEWELLARSWAKGDRKGESRLLFGTLDFEDGKATFQAMQLQTAPVLLLYYPTIGPNAKTSGNNPVRYDFTTGSDNADPIHAWLSRQLPADAPKPPVVRPTDYVKIATLTTITLGVISLISVAWPYMLPYIQSRNLWAILSIIAILLFTSGHMFNHIRKVPYVAADGKGKVTYFAGGFQNQLGLETQIIAAIYGVLAFATISLALKVPRMVDPRSQQIAVIVWGGVIFGTYSFLLSIFRVKNGGYPFYLPPF